MHQIQNDLQSKIDTKISKEIYSVQQVLESLVKLKQNQNQMQSQSRESDFIQCIETMKETGEKENQQEQVNSYITNAIIKENKLGIDYKTKADWYASLLMYNSY